MNQRWMDSCHQEQKCFPSWQHPAGRPDRQDQWILHPATQRRPPYFSNDSRSISLKARTVSDRQPDWMWVIGAVGEIRNWVEKKRTNTKQTCESNDTIKSTDELQLLRSSEWWLSIGASKSWAKPGYRYRKYSQNEVYSQKFISNQEDIISQDSNIISQPDGDGCKGVRLDMTEWP